MNWENYRFFTVWIRHDLYNHYFWVDGEVFTYNYDEKSFLRIFHKDPKKSFTYEHITFFPLENECNNYKSSIKYWNYIQPPLGSNFIDISEYIKKLMKRETNLEKILQSI